MPRNRAGASLDGAILERHGERPSVPENPSESPERPRAHRESIGVYVHFPYCLTKCPYCDFLSVPTGCDAIPHVEYADAVIAEVERRSAALDGAPLHSVFFGGGTPSLWKPAELGRVLSAIRERCEGGENAEVTVECNPGSFDRDRAAELLSVGVNRISIGIQSLSRDRLSFLGRSHDEHEGLAAVQVARDVGFTNVSGDLIFGVSGQTDHAAAEEASVVASTGVSHLSAYALTIEPGTRFGELARRGRLPLLADDVVADAFTNVERELEARGYLHYEISNYARPGAESRHNLGYWRGEPYVGLGVGAWGTLRTGTHKVRYRNTPALDRYLRIGAELRAEPLDRESRLIAAFEHITPEIDVTERLMLGLRLLEGVDIDSLEADTKVPVWTAARERRAAQWLSRGALVFSAGRLRLARSHWLVADSVIRELV